MSDDLPLEALLEFLNACEAGVAAAKHRIKEGKKLDDGTIDFSKLFWEHKQGEKGPFEQTSDKANQNSFLWQKLKAELKEHSGFWEHAGFRYWFDMKNENVIDRRKTP